MNTQNLTLLIDVAAGRAEADLVITNAKVVDVFNGTIIEGNVAIVDGLIAGIGSYQGKESFDGQGKYLVPGFIDAHVHIESSLLDPHSFSDLLLPCGTTTAIADPHEICNVCGLEGFDYMLQESQNLPLSLFFMIPSCVPATPFEHSGAILDAQAIQSRIDVKRVLGLGEMMDMVGTVQADPSVVDKLTVAHQAQKLIDGHGPALAGLNLNAFAAAGIHTDHECTTKEELIERIKCGIYVLLREGSASHDLVNLLGGVTSQNSRFCLFCTDDRQPRSIIEEGHIDNHLRLAVAEGVNPIEAIRMATLNAAECYNLRDRGAIACGRRADLVLLSDLKDFKVEAVWTKGERYQAPRSHRQQAICPSVSARVNIGNFTVADLRLKIDQKRVRVIELIADSIGTIAGEEIVNVDQAGYYQHNPTLDLVKIAVVERHSGSGNVGLGLLRGYGLQGGAVATTIAHDSHNIIVAGDNDADMALAVETLAQLGGGIVMIHQGKVLDQMALPIAGLMTNRGPHYVIEKLQSMHTKALEYLKINPAIDPFMTLSFMALPVIPQLRVTDMGLFDVTSHSFVTLTLP